MALNKEILQEIEEYINNYYFEYGISPSVRTIAQHMGVGKSSVQRYIDRMRNDGELSDSPVGVITDEISRHRQPMQQVGLVGSVSCGDLTFASQNITEYFSLPTSLTGGGEFFMLQAHGDSMINAGIDNGDLVLIRKQNTANNGDIVVALYGDDTTLKRFYKDDEHHRFILHPENERLDDIIVDGDLVIQGIATKVLKDLM